MKAVCLHNRGDVRVDEVDDPVIQDARDIIVRITSTAICGSDLHLYDFFVPFVKPGDVLGHEPMGIVEEVGSEVRTFKKGDRVVVPFTISCGECWFCRQHLFASCDRTNPDHQKKIAEKMLGHSPAGFFGYSHMVGVFPGGQAQYMRVPHADVGCLKIDSDLTDEQVLFLSDIFPTGYMAAENAQIEPGDTVAVWGCGPVGQFCIQSAWMLGAGRVVAIDCVPERLDMAYEVGHAETINFLEENVYETLQAMTNERGPDRCIDAVGAESHGWGGFDAVYDNVKSKLGLATDRAHALREAIYCCRKAGTVSVPGVYVGFPDKFPMGAVMNKALTIKTGQTHVPKYHRMLLEHIENGDIDPSFVVTHRVPLEEAPEAYRAFRDKEDGCIKVILQP